MERIMQEILEERYKQDLKWGQQNHPCLDQAIKKNPHFDGERMCQEYKIPSQERIKFTTDIKAKRGDLTWADIALEEFSEVVSEFDIYKRRKELIQLTSVCVAWIEKIDRDIAELKCIDSLCELRADNMRPFQLSEERLLKKLQEKHGE